MEEGLAKRLKVALGDTVTFMGDTQEFRAKVTSLRKVDWESLRPNFYFIFPEGALDGQPQSWLTSFRWENGNGMLTQLNRQFPTISLLDIGAILKQVGQVLEQVSRALEVMVVLVTACGMLLLLAQVQVGMRQRHQELVVWRTLGAGKKLLRTTLWCEFAMLGFVSGLVAAIGAETVPFNQNAPYLLSSPRKLPEQRLTLNQSRTQPAAEKRQQQRSAARQNNPQSPVWLPRKIKHFRLQHCQRRFRTNCGHQAGNKPKHGELTPQRESVEFIDFKYSPTKITQTNKIINHMR